VEPPVVRPDERHRVDLLGLPLEEDRQLLEPIVDRPFRAGQVYNAIYRRGARGFDEMTDLKKELRARLERRFEIGWPREDERHASADGTVKHLFRLNDGATIETVDIPDGERRTICLSSQAGCALACAFCVTGYWGAGRNLTAGEIVGQVLAVRGALGPTDPLNLVFMGMGEPLQNLEEVRRAMEILSEYISWRRITLSTVGVVPGIEAMARWAKRPNLAISLHAPDDRRRSRIMPINDSYPLSQLLAALQRYSLERRRRITFEYILIRDFNDAVADADELAALLGGLKAKVNLIPVNPDPVLGEGMVPPADEVVDAFRDRLLSHGLFTTIRRRRGDDVSAACGQLRAPSREPRGFRRSNLRF
jgi:23S rRNA (adenine2503-C2)-methyltransferase